MISIVVVLCIRGIHYITFPNPWKGNRKRIVLPPHVQLSFYNFLSLRASAVTCRIACW